MATVDRPADADYYYTTPATATVRYTIDRKTSISNVIRAREAAEHMGMFAWMPYSWLAIYWHALQKDGSALADLEEDAGEMAGNGRAATKTTIEGKCARSYDWIN